jgi:DNA polymerase-1
MEFNSLTKRISEAFGVEPSTGEMTRPSPVDGVEAGAPEKSPGGDTPADEVRRVEAWLKAIPFDRSLYVQVTDLQALEDWIAAATEQGFVAFDTETTALDAMSAKLCGVALALEPNRACYIPLAHRAGDGLDFTGAGEIAQLPMESALPRLKALLEDDSVLKIGQNIKYDALIMRRHGDIRVAPYDDTMLMAYACDQGRGGLAGFGMDELSKRHLGHTPIAFTDVAGKGKAQSTFDCIAVDKATEYAAEDADVTLRL